MANGSGSGSQTQSTAEKRVEGNMRRLSKERGTRRSWGEEEPVGSLGQAGQTLIRWVDKHQGPMQELGTVFTIL